MNPMRFAKVAVCVLTVAIVISPLGISQEQLPNTPSQPYATPTYSTTHANAGEQPSYKVYALGTLARDPEFGQWIAETITQIIEPGAWTIDGGKCVVRYHAPNRILVVYHNSRVQAKVNAFLQNLSQAVATKNNTATRQATAQQRNVVPTSHNTPALLPTSSAMPVPSPYATPPSWQRPKHLIHFIIRYEGAGIIDDTIADVIKSYNNPSPSVVSPVRSAGRASCSTNPPAVPLSPNMQFPQPFNDTPVAVPATAVMPRADAVPPQLPSY